MPALDDPVTTTPATPEPEVHEPAPVPAVGQKATQSLMADIADDMGNLLTQHANLLQAEVRDGARNAAGWFGGLIVGTVFTVLGFLFAAISGVYGLQAGSDLPLWACWLIVGGSLLVIGGGLAVFGVIRLTGVNLIPHRTIQSLSETWSWLVKRSRT